jgi:hypothetical protein
VEVLKTAVRVRNTGSSDEGICAVKGPWCEAADFGPTIGVEFVLTGKIRQVCVPCYLTKTRSEEWVAD